MTTKILVRSYRRRRQPLTRTATIKAGIRELRRLKADGDLKHVCWVEASDTDSQLLDDPKYGFRRNHCSVPNLEPQDVKNEVAAAATIHHEAIHARDISKDGPTSSTWENEVRAQEETITFLKDWRAQERESLTPDTKRLRNLDEQIQSFEHGLVYLKRNHGAEYMSERFGG